MKRSIQARVALTFSLLMAVALLAIGLVNLFFLGDVYRRQKERALVRSWEMIDASEEDGTTDEIENYCSVNALTYAVADPNLNFLYTNSPDGEAMASRLFGNLMQIEDENTEMLRSDENYRLIKFHDSRNEMDYLELWGVLENGNYYIALTPLESIDRAAGLSTRFFVYVGLVAVGISAVLIWFITRRLVAPVRELTALSQRMAGLDFDARYTSGGEDEIGELGANFNAMSDQLEGAVTELKKANLSLQQDVEEKTRIDEMRREFISNVSHELKTPIALIRGYAEGLKDAVADEESRDFYCDVIADEAEKMNALVRQLITLDQLEAGLAELNVERFDLTALIRGVIAASDVIIRKREAEVVFEQNMPLWVWGDAFRIEEVVTNYLTNALDHADGARCIEISCAQTGDVVTTCVFNTGSPIPEEQLPHIWEKFYKVDAARTRAYGGSGIGLSIVRAIMEQHHQRCWAENRPDGVAFCFTLDAKTHI